jgi:hypothetical protein
MEHAFKYTIKFPCKKLTALGYRFIEHAYDGPIQLDLKSCSISVDVIEIAVEDLHSMGIYDFTITVNPLIEHA